MSAILEFAERLRHQVDIVSTVEGYVQLKRTGVNHKGLCPFHREKTPSFTVNASKQIFHCFGCGAGGDVIKFIQLIERLDWIDALRQLAEQHNMQLPARSGDAARDDESRAERERLLSVSRLAHEFFAGNLEEALRTGRGEIASYLEKRSVDADLARRFGLGLAPEEWSRFLEYARAKGFEEKTVLAAGLASRNEEKGRTWDRFRNRLIFPISDGSGRPIAFGGRLFAAADAQTDAPKYVNSPETPLYRKGQHLYALHLARDAMAREGYALVMEGYLDVMRAHQFGFEHAVATCGTALTEEQARALKRFAKRVVLVYDGDDAGQKAMMKALEALTAQELEVRAARLPEGHDPDSFLLAEGAEAFRRTVADAPGFFDFAFEHYCAQTRRDSPEGKAWIVEQMAPLVRGIGSEIVRGEYTRLLAGRLLLDTQVVARSVRGREERGRMELVEAASQGAAGGEWTRRDALVLRLCVENSAARAYLRPRMKADWLGHPQLCRLMGAVFAWPDERELNWLEVLTLAENEEQERLLRALSLADEGVNASEEMLAQLVQRLEFQYRRRRTVAIVQDVRSGGTAQSLAAAADALQVLSPAAGRVVSPGTSGGEGAAGVEQ